jgi:uncharacterized damage-inducible protein DinB
MFADYLRSQLAQVRSGLNQLLEELDESDLDFRPHPQAWTVRELLLHIAHEEHGEVQHGITRTLAQWPDEFDAAGHQSISSITSRLEATRAETERFLAGLNDSDLAAEIETPWGARDSLLALLGHVLEHEVHHRAELSLVAGMLGRKGLDA